MPAKKNSTHEKEVQAALAWLAAHGTPQDAANLVRFGIAATNPLGVSMANVQVLAKQLGRNHSLAAALWDTNCYEARMLTAFVADPVLLTPTQMDRWCRDFDNWGICDTLCFKLFDQSPHAWAKVEQWHDKPQEFIKRAAFALLASLAGHDKQASDGQFLDTFPLIEKASTDERNFVKKGVSWALRRIGTRGPFLKAESLALARRLAESPNPAARWIGKDTIRDLTKTPKAKSK